MNKAVTPPESTSPLSTALPAPQVSSPIPDPPFPPAPAVASDEFAESHPEKQHHHHKHHRHHQHGEPKAAAGAEGKAELADGKELLPGKINEIPTGGAIQEVPQSDTIPQQQVGPETEEKVKSTHKKHKHRHGHGEHKAAEKANIDVDVVVHAAAVDSPRLFGERPRKAHPEEGPQAVPQKVEADAQEPLSINVEKPEMKDVPLPIESNTNVRQPQASPASGKDQTPDQVPAAPVVPVTAAAVEKKAVPETAEKICVPPAEASKMGALEGKSISDLTTERRDAPGEKPSPGPQTSPAEGLPGLSVEQPVPEEKRLPAGMVSAPPAEQLIEETKVEVPATAEVTVPAAIAEPETNRSPKSRSKAKSKSKHAHHKKPSPLTGIVPAPISVPLNAYNPQAEPVLPPSEHPTEQPAKEEAKKITPTVSDIQGEPIKIPVPPPLPVPTVIALTPKPAAEGTAPFMSTNEPSPAEASYESGSYDSIEEPRLVVALDNPAPPLPGEEESYESGSCASASDPEPPVVAGESYESGSYSGGGESGIAVPERSGGGKEPGCEPVVIDGKNAHFILLLLFANLLLVLTVGSVIICNAVEIRRTRSRLKGIRSAGAAWNQAQQNVTSTINDSFSSATSNRSSEFELQAATFFDPGINMSEILARSADVQNFSISSNESITAMLGSEDQVPDLLETTTQTVCDRLDSANQYFDTLFTSTYPLMTAMQALVSALASASTVRTSAETTLLACKSTLESSIPTVMDTIQYINAFFEVTTAWFHPGSMMVAKKAKRVILISVNSANVYMRSVLDTSVMNSQIDYVYFSSSGWYYSLNFYDAVIFDCLDGYNDHATFDTFVQKSMVAFMDRGHAILFSHDVFSQSGWDADLYKYCGIAQQSTDNSYSSTIYKYSASNACHQIFSYPNDLFTATSINTQETHGPRTSTLLGADLLYGLGGYTYFYLVARTNTTSTQKCAISMAGHNTPLATAEKQILNNVAYWMVHEDYHYGGH